MSIMNSGGMDEFEVSTRSTSRTVDLKIYYTEGLGPRI